MGVEVDANKKHNLPNTAFVQEDKWLLREYFLISLWVNRSSQDLSQELLPFDYSGYLKSFVITDFFSFPSLLSGKDHVPFLQVVHLNWIAKTICQRVFSEYAWLLKTG